MKIKTILSLILTLLIVVPLSAQKWDWTNTIKGAGNNYVWDLATDDQGNVFAAGRMKFNAGFSTDTGELVLTAQGFETDAYVAKYSPSGKLQWVSTDGGPQPDWGRRVEAGPDGSVYYVGDYCDTAVFGGSITIMAQGTSVVGDPFAATRNIFIAKYDSSGNILWAKSAGGPEKDSKAFGLDVDDLGNLYVTGFVSGVVNFDSLTIGTANKRYGFVAKYTPSGNVAWVFLIHDQEGNRCEDIRLSEDQSSFYITGAYSRNMVLGGITYPGNSPSWGDFFVAKFDTSGQFQWAEVANGAFQDKGWALEVDSKDNVYVLGEFSNNIEFDSTLTLNSLGTGSGPTNALNGRDAFFVKYDKNGKFKWVKQLGNSAYVFAKNLTIDPYDHPIICVVFQDTLFYEGAPLAISADATDGIFINYDSLGNISWYKKIGDIGQENAWAITHDQQGNLYAGGAYEFSIQLDDTTISSTFGGRDAFFGKLFPPIDAEIQTSLADVCIDGDLQLNATGKGGPLSYEWTLFDSDTLMSMGSSPLFNFPNIGMYDAQLVVSNGRESDTIEVMNLVTVNPNPTIDLGVDTSFCESSSLELSPGSGFSSYLWLNSSTDSIIVVNQSGLYWVEVTDANGCKATDSIQVDISPLPIVDLGSDTLFINGDSLTLDAGAGFATYLWSDGSISSTITVKDSGEYWVMVVDENGCSAADTINVSVGINTSVAQNGMDSGIQIYPNPVQNNGAISLEGLNDAQTYTLVMRDLRGATVVKEQIKSNHTLSFNSSLIVPGIYVYTLMTEVETVAIGKLMIQ